MISMSHLSSKKLTNSNMLFMTMFEVALGESVMLNSTDKLKTVLLKDDKLLTYLQVFSKKQGCAIAKAINSQDIKDLATVYHDLEPISDKFLNNKKNQRKYLRQPSIDVINKFENKRNQNHKIN